MVFVTCLGSSKVVKNKLVSEIVDNRGESKSVPKLSNPFVVSCRVVSLCDDWVRLEYEPRVLQESKLEIKSFLKIQKEKKNAKEALKKRKKKKKKEVVEMA